MFQKCKQKVGGGRGGGAVDPSPKSVFTMSYEKDVMLGELYLVFL